MATNGSNGSNAVLTAIRGETEIREMRQWLNVELEINDCFPFKYFLKGNGIKYEVSAMGDFWFHFEVFVNDAEKEVTNGFLSTL